MTHTVLNKVGCKITKMYIFHRRTYTRLNKKIFEISIVLYNIIRYNIIKAHDNNIMIKYNSRVILLQ